MYWINVSEYNWPEDFSIKANKNKNIKIETLIRDH